MESGNYIHIPYKVLMRRDLSQNAKLLYGLVGGFFDGEFTAGNIYISNVLGISKRSVQRALGELKDKHIAIATNVLKGGRVVGRIITLTKRYE